MKPYLIASLIGYFLGCVNPAYFFAKAKGFDIRTRGSGNAGASNAKVTMGTKYFIICALYDSLKSAASVLICRYLFPGVDAVDVLGGCMAVVGHCFPFYLNFKGGKGFAAYMGMILALDFKFLVIILVLGVILTFVSNWIVTATYTVIISFPIYNAIIGNSKLTVIFLALTSLIIFLKHIPNIRKIIRKREIGVNGKPVGWAIIKDDKFIVDELKQPEEKEEEKQD